MKKQSVLRVSILLSALVLLCAMLCACARNDVESNPTGEARYGRPTDSYGYYDNNNGSVFDREMDVLDGEWDTLEDDVFGRKETDGGAMDGTPDGADTYGATYDTNLDDQMHSTDKKADKK